MSKENYYIEQVEHFNNVFGKLNNEKPTLIDEKEAQFIYDFIKEDAFGDIMYVLSAGILAFGLKDKFKTLFDEIQASNMSKACDTENDAKQTSTSISTIKGVETYHEKVGDKYIVYRSSDRKVQKNHKYFRPNLKQCFNDEDLKRITN